MDNENKNTKDKIKSLWDSNFCNIKEATTKAEKRTPAKMHIAIEIANVLFENDDYSKIFPHAVETLQYLTMSPSLNVYAFTYVKTTTAHDIHDKVLKKLGIKFSYINENPEISDPNLSLRKLYYDVLIDSAAGFNPKNDWYWIDKLLRISNVLIDEKNKNIKLPPKHVAAYLSPELDLQTKIIRGSDQYKR